MSRHGNITLECWDGEYRFRLGYREICDLEEAFDCGIQWLANRMLTENARMKHMREVLRIALIGGGMEPQEALEKVKRFVENQNPVNNRQIAFLVLNAALGAIAEEDVGKLPGDGEATEMSRSPVEKPDLPH